MEKEIRKFLTSVSVLGLLASCSGAGTLEATSGNTGMAAQRTGTFVDHDALARRYESRARKLLEIAAEHEKRLRDFKHDGEKNHLSGIQGQNSELRAAALVQKCRLGAEKATEAAFHHRMASRLDNLGNFGKRDYIASTALH